MMKSLTIIKIVNVGTIIATIFSFILLFVPNVNKTFALMAVILGIIFIYTLAFFKNLKDDVKNNMEEVSKLKEKFETAKKISDLDSRLKLVEGRFKK